MAGGGKPDWLVAIVATSELHEALAVFDLSFLTGLRRLSAHGKERG